jgi:4'-phosphopantetheinyl transferase
MRLRSIIFRLRKLRPFYALPSETKCAAFFACWTRKEAYIKARGRGLSIPLDSFEVSFSPGKLPELLNVRDDDIQESADWALFDLQPASGYARALAIKGSGWKLSQWDFTDLLAS